MIQSTDFHLLQNEGYDTILHILSAYVVNLQKGTDIDLFFRQLLLGENHFSEKEMIVLNNLVAEELDFINQSIKPAHEIAEVNMQSVILPISGQCNLRCSYCFAQTKGDFGFKDITPQKCKEIIDFVFENNRQDVLCNLNFFGGEPMLNTKTIQQAIMYVRSKYANRKVSFGITTNGTILSEADLMFIKEYGVKLLVSFDGPADIAPHRVYSSGKHSAEKVLNNIKRLKEVGIDFQIRVTISSDCGNLKRIYEYFESLEVPFAAVLAYKSRNINETCIYEGKTDFFQKQYEELQRFYQQRIECDLPIYCYSITNDITTIKKRNLRSFACGGGINIFAVTDNGNIYSCEHLAFDEKYAVGNIASGIDKKVLKSMQPDDVNSILKCNDCWVRFFCSAGCFSEKMLIGRTSKSLPKEECALKRIYWDFILTLYLILEKRIKENMSK